MGKDLKGKELGRGILQRKDGKYQARFLSICGKRKSKNFNYLQDARKWLAETKEADEKGSDLFGDMYSTTVNDWYEFWIVNIKEKTVRLNTLRNYKERYCKNIKPVIGKMVISDVKPMHCQRVLNLMDNHYSGSTIYQCYITMCNMFNSALENELVLRNPMTKSVKLPKPIIKKNRVLTLEEQIKFLKEAKKGLYYKQFFFMLNTGVRSGEMIGLKWEDIDFDRNMISIRRTMDYRYATKDWRIGPPKTKSSIREIPITKANREMLLDMKLDYGFGRTAEEEFKDFVFLNKNGKPIKNSTYDSYLQRITKKAGIKNISMHTLRHSFATRCVEAGMKPKTLQMILGHANIGVTMNLYVHLTDEEKMKEIEKFEAYYETNLNNLPIYIEY